MAASNKGYLIAFIKVNDEEAFKEFLNFAAGVDKMGGKFLAKDTSPESVESAQGANEGLSVILEFESKEAASKFYNSDGYQEAKKIRQPISDTSLSIVEGLESSAKENKATTQAEKKAYIVFHIKVNDPEVFKTEYVRAVPDLAAAGGKLLVRGPANPIESKQGENEGNTVVIEFESLAKAKAWYSSDAYKKAIMIREPISKASVTIVEGI